MPRPAPGRAFHGDWFGYAKTVRHRHCRGIDFAAVPGVLRQSGSVRNGREGRRRAASVAERPRAASRAGIALGRACRFRVPMETAQRARPRRSSEFARMIAWSRPATQVLVRRSFEPILDLREPVSDGWCAWPAVDFGPQRESLKAGAGFPPYTGGSGSSPTRRRGPLHFLCFSARVWALLLC